MESETIVVLVILALIVGFFVWRSRRGNGSSGSTGGKSKDERKRRY